MVRHHRTVFISGMGAVSAAGANLAETLASFAAGERRGAPVSLFPTPLTCPVFEVRAIPGPEPAVPVARTLRLAFAAVHEALADAGFGDSLRGVRAGVCLGTTVACQLNDLDFYTAYRGTGAAPLEAVDRFLRGNLAAAVARQFHAAGPTVTVTNACASGTDAIGVALTWLRAGLCDVVITGGADELNRIPLCGFNSLSVVSPVLCAPFDRERQGLNLGEGAGILILETAASLRRRGADSALFVAGFGAAADAHHLTAPRPDGTGLEAALRTALAEAGIEPKDVAFVNAHGTGTHDNDKVEGGVLARFFGSGLPFLSTKGFTGHTLGAAGGLEAVFTAAALRDGWIPASPGFVTRDEEISVAPVRERTAVTGRFAVSTSLAFGGSNAVVVIGRVSPGLRTSQNGKNAAALAGGLRQAAENDVAVAVRSAPVPGSMNILGIGVVCARGRGVGALEAALRRGWEPPSWLETPFLPPGTRFPVYAVAAETVTDKNVLGGGLRRADRFSRMAVLAAADALADSGLVLEDKARVGIIVATALGPHVTTFRFLDEILDHGDASVSPTVFSHSVHNVAAAYAGLALGLRGPALTLTEFKFPFQHALRLARAWVDNGRCDYVLVGSVDELGAVMEYVCSRKLRLAPDGRIAPFGFSSRPGAVPGEGSAFLLLSRRDTPRAYASVTGVELGTDALSRASAPDSRTSAPDLTLLEADGMLPDETAYAGLLAGGQRVAGYAPLFGSLLSGSAFHVAVAALMLRDQVVYACPVPESAHGLNLPTTSGPARLETVVCRGLDCAGAGAAVYLQNCAARR